MHGSVLHGFKQFVLLREGPAAWQSIAAGTSAEGWYHANRVYPDQEFRQLVLAAASRWERPPNDVIVDFGEVLAPVLLNLYQAFIDPRWRTLDLLMNTESVIHRTVRLRDLGADPPQIRPERITADEVHIQYTSPRRLCAIAMGLCRGIAGHYGDRITLDQPQCMDRGDPACRLVVRLLPPVAAA